MTDNLGPQFLYHGTAQPVKGDKILPAKVHGGPSYWGDMGSTRGEPANEHAWAHPDENKAWQFAHDRVIHTANEHDWNPRARVFAVHPNEKQSPGNDRSIPGEVKAPHFDISHPIDIMPGRQGTIPDVNWNNHTLHTGLFTEDEDANHPANLSVQFGHYHGRWGEQGEARIRSEAKIEDMDRYVDRAKTVSDKLPTREATEDQPLPGLRDAGRRRF